MRMESGVIRTSAVLIAADGVQSLYPSLHDVPEPLRRRVRESTTGRNSGVILIADRRGKEQLERAARFHQISRERDLADAGLPWGRIWPALVALAIGVAGAWLAFVVRF
jgi:hypothetical protein